MEQRIPEDTIQEILLRADIVDVLGEYVQLKKSGASYKGLCPFHSEKTPSFTVNPSRGTYHCFGCKEGGNVVRFLMQHEQLAFPETIQMLAARYGVRLPAPSARRQRDTLQPLYDLHQAAAAFLHAYLLHQATAQQARAYCRQRHITSDIAGRFMLGYAPDAWEVLTREMQRQGFSEALLIQSGLVVSRGEKPGVYDRFRHRLMFPIHDRSGRPVAFGGRLLESSEAFPAPKYLNSPETPIFHKSRTLYGLHVAKQAIRQTGQALVVEGYTDVLACHRHGVTQAVGTLGTALTARHVDMLRNLAKEVLLVFDGDSAGGAAAERSLGLFLDAGMRTRIVELPSGEDPDSFLQHHGREAFVQCLEDAVTFVEYLLARSQRFSDVQTPTGRADCVARIFPLLRKVDDQVERWSYVALLAERVGVPIDVLQREMYSRATRAALERPAASPAASVLTERQRPLPTPAWPPAEYDLLRLALHDGHRLAQLRRELLPDAFQTSLLRELYSMLLQAPAWDGPAAFAALVEQVDSDEKRRVLAEMATEPVLGDAAERGKMMHDCLRQLRQRQTKARLHEIRKEIRGADQRGDAAEQRRLLEVYAGLRQEMRSQ